jgi:hypothetical protein
VLWVLLLCHFDKCLSAESHCLKCYSVKLFYYLNIIWLSGILLRVILMTVILLNIMLLGVTLLKIIMLGIILLLSFYWNIILLSVIRLSVIPQHFSVEYFCNSAKSHSTE